VQRIPETLKHRFEKIKNDDPRDATGTTNLINSQKYFYILRRLPGGFTETPA
jgi:hypothetical protein